MRTRVNKAQIISSPVGETLTVYDVSSVREKLVAALERDGAIQIDLEKVNDCDTSGVQLLYSLNVSARKLGKDLNLINPSDCVRTAFERAAIPMNMFDFDQEGV